jgi:hypothetical protein
MMHQALVPGDNAAQNSSASRSFLSHWPLRNSTTLLGRFISKESHQLLFAVCRYVALHSGWHVRGLHR